MKNKKGFTLIEIIGAIVILGIISIIAFVAYTSSLKGFRDDFYVSLERSLKEAGKEFFNDNRNYRPTKILYAQEVPLSTLITKNYLSDLEDYNGNSCDNSSYVIVIKEGRDKYSYHACLSCSGDDYNNTEDNKYCDRTWLDPTKVKYGIGTLEDLFLYKGTSREKLRENLEIPVSYVRYDDDDNIIATIRGVGEGEPTIVPKDIDVVNTNVVGEYSVLYEYREEKADRRVVVYETDAPPTTYKNKRTIITTLAGTPKNETVDYSSGQWAQNVIVTFNVKNEHEIGQWKVKSIQWNKDGRWKDLCLVEGVTCETTESGGEKSQPYSYTLTATISVEMNEEVQFRVIDTNGNISKETPAIDMKIDRTSPTCTLKIPTTKGDNDWYNTDVVINFDTYQDLKSGTEDKLVSGIEKSNIQISTADLSLTNKITTATHNTDTSAATYIGVVEDKARNFATCSSPEFKRDATAPTCSLSGHATISCTDEEVNGTKSLVNRWYYGTKSAPAATDYTTVTAIATFTKDASSNVTTNADYYAFAKDSAGNISVGSKYTYYKVTYDAHGGITLSKSSEIVRKDNNADLSQTLAKDGYIFKGWNTDQNATTGLTSHKVTDNVTLHAIYEECGDGNYCKNNVRTPCPCGKYGNGVTTASTEAGACQVCPAGSYCSGGTHKATCGENKISAAGACTCQDCPSGQQANDAHTQCLTPSPSVTLLKAVADSKVAICGRGEISTASTTSKICNTSAGQACPCEINALMISPPSGKTLKNVTVTFTHLPDSHNETTNYYDLTSRPTTGNECKNAYFEYGKIAGYEYLYKHAFYGDTFFSSDQGKNIDNRSNGCGTKGHFFVGYAVYNEETKKYEKKHADSVLLRFRNSTSQEHVDGTVSVTYTDDTTGSYSFDFK